MAWTIPNTGWVAGSLLPETELNKIGANLQYLKDFYDFEGALTTVPVMTVGRSLLVSPGTLGTIVTTVPITNRIVSATITVMYNETHPSNAMLGATREAPVIQEVGSYWNLSGWSPSITAAGASPDNDVAIYWCIISLPF